MIIKVLGPGCTNCVNLERVTRQAVDALGVDATIEKVTDYPTIAGYGVMATPARSANFSPRWPSSHPAARDSPERS